MTLKIGFILLSHNKPHQLLRLTKTLNKMFCFPPIVCHHDFSKCTLDTAEFEENVSFVQPHVVTGWSKFSVVDAMMQSLKMLYAEATAPDWFILLSGSDYPIKPASVILRDLSSTLCNVHIQSNKLTYKLFKEYEKSKNSWQRAHFKRYCSVRLGFPYIDRKLRIKIKKIKRIRLCHPFLASRFIPFSEEFPCYSGEHWFCADRGAAGYLLDYHQKEPALANYFRSIDFDRVVPEEAYYHTVFHNSPDLKISSNCFRYIDWSMNDGPHPKTLTLGDLPKLKQSSAHFARKLNLGRDPELFVQLDKMIFSVQADKVIGI